MNLCLTSTQRRRKRFQCAQTNKHSEVSAARPWTWTERHIHLFLKVFVKAAGQEERWEMTSETLLHLDLTQHHMWRSGSVESWGSAAGPHRGHTQGQDVSEQTAARLSVTQHDVIAQPHVITAACCNNLPHRVFYLILPDVSCVCVAGFTHQFQ